MSSAEIGVFGGSGFYSFLSEVETVEIDTPYGPPSAPPVIGDVGGRRVAFIPRHGQRHEFPPHRVPYRANVWAMKELGVGRILGPNACGSLQSDVMPGEFVICDQLVDRTRDRPNTFYDGPGHDAHLLRGPVLRRDARGRDRARVTSWRSRCTIAARWW